jgi:hypothetical protein
LNQHRILIARTDRSQANQGLVELRITGIDNNAMRQGLQLGFSGNRDDIIDANGSNNSRTELLVTPTKHVALAAND